MEANVCDSLYLSAPAQTMGMFFKKTFRHLPPFSIAFAIRNVDRNSSSDAKLSIDVEVYVEVNVINLYNSNSDIYEAKQNH